jgi:two-component system, NarL family, response regulator LiaR
MSENPVLTVLLADHHRLFRESLRDLLDEHDIEVVGEAQHATEAVRLVSETKPTVVLTELDLPGATEGEIDITRRLRFASPQSAIVVLTVFADGERISAAVHAGASGYLLKDAAVEDIVGSVRAAGQGEAVLSPRIAAYVLEQMRESSPPLDRPEDLTLRLTVREREVLRLMAMGKDNNGIAEELVISDQTAKNHVSSVLGKLEVSNRIQAAVYAVRERVV